MNTRKFVARFYAPLGVGLGLLVAGTMLEFSEKDLRSSSLRVSVLGVSVELPIPERYKSEALARLVVFMVAGIFVAFGLSTDFSHHFPKRLKMDVFFDIEGIEKSLKVFDNEDRKALRFDDNWRASLKLYDSVVKEAFREILTAEGADDSAVSAIVRANLHSHGETSFVVERVSLLRYRICESSGHLDHRVDAPGVPSFGWRTEFALRPTVHDHLQIGFWDLFRGKYLLCPEFKQIFRVHGYSATKAMDHTVIGATKVITLPVPWIEKTIYLWREEKLGLAVPIAYAVYYWNA